MSKKLGVASFVLILLLAGGAAYYFLRVKPADKAPASASTSTSASAAASASGNQQKTSAAVADDFTYTTPVGWYPLSQSVLDNVEAAKGIGHNTTPDVFFYVSPDSSANRPTNASQLKTVPLETIKKLPAFKLIKSSTTKVGGETGQSFLYTTGTASEDKNQLVAVIHNDKVYLLLATGPADKFDANQAAIDKIIASFQFK